MTVKIQSVHKRLSQYSFPYIGIKQTSYIHNSEKAAIKYNISILVRSYVLRYSEQTRLQPLTNPSEDSQAWKTYSYLDEGAARGTEWDNRRIRCTVALHWDWLQHHRLYRRQSNLAVMCKDTYLPGEHFSTTFLYKKKKNGNECWQQHVTVLYSEHLISIEKLPWEKEKQEEKSPA